MLTFQLINSNHFLKSSLSKCIGLACISFFWEICKLRMIMNKVLWHCGKFPSPQRYHADGLRGLNPYTAREEGELGVRVHTHLCTLLMRAHTHTRWHRMVWITITVFFKSLKKLADRLTHYLFIGGVCTVQRVNRAKKLFKPVQNHWQKAGPNSSTFPHSSCSSRKGCMNPCLNLLLISAHENPFLELLVKGEFPTLVIIHFIFSLYVLSAAF